MRCESISTAHHPVGRLPEVGPLYLNRPVSVLVGGHHGRRFRLACLPPPDRRAWRQARSDARLLGQPRGRRLSDLGLGTVKGSSGKVFWPTIRGSSACCSYAHPRSNRSTTCRSSCGSDIGPARRTSEAPARFICRSMASSRNYATAGKIAGWARPSAPYFLSPTALA